jgi:hypothetical protein
MTTVIAMEEEFKKSHGDPISIAKLIANDSFKKLLEENRYVLDNVDDKIWLC